MATWKQRLIREVLETTSGTAEATTAANAILAREVTFNLLDADYTEQDFLTGQEGAQVEDLSNIRAGATYQVEAAPGPVSTVPAYAHLLQSSALVMADDDGDTVFTPLPVGTEIPSCTQQLRNGAHMQTVVGVRGSFGFTAEVNKRANFSFTRQGQYQAPVAFVSEAHDFSGWPRGLECTPENMFAFTLGGTKLCVTSFSFTDGRTPKVNEYMNCVGTKLSPRMFTGSMTVKHPDLATKDLLSMVKDVVIEPLIFTLGKTAGQIITVTAPNVQIKAPSEQEINGDLGLSLDLRFLPTAASDDEIEIRFS
ncbi:phage tail tube protein [Celeribacter baekdonensis]|uniref:phage tail tube protein n=1 Tax=Celeribacter baekdonensis TaxID=875171 RepID=UPI0030DC9B4E|tara:strand:- start:11947 stop:12873 length:927 start_codon:yes stop_codon:yes gene_type:complete